MDRSNLGVVETGTGAMQVPAALVVDPEYADVSLQVGDEIPEMQVCILNGAQQKVVRGFLGGSKQNFSVTQKLWFCPAGEEETLFHCPFLADQLHGALICVSCFGYSHDRGSSCLCREGAQRSTS